MEQTHMLRARAPQTLDACRELLVRTFEPIDAESVATSFLRLEHDTGFFSGLYSGSPEHIEEVDFRKLFRGYDFRNPKVFKRLAWREAFMGYQFTMWRLKHDHHEEHDGTFHNVEAVLHNAQDELVAKVCLCLSCLDEGRGLTVLVSHLDGPNRSDLLEMLSAVVETAVDGDFEMEEWRRLLFVCDWEVRKQDRGQGLGLALLKRALKTAFRGLPGPQCVAVRLAPMQSLAEAAGVDERVLLPELDMANRSLRAYWDAQVIEAGVLPRSVGPVVYVPASPHFQGGSHHHELYRLGELMMTARKYDGLPWP